MRRKSQTLLGVAWYRPEQWASLRSLASDAEILEEIHAEWVILARKTMRDLAAQGVAVRKVDVDVNDLQAWCIGQKRPLDSSARAEYAGKQLRDAHEGPSPR